MAHSALLLILLLLTSQNSQELAPQGCTYAKGSYTCDFQRWTPPLQDKDFDPGPLYFLTVTNINGTIPPGAFSGLHGPVTKKHAYLYFLCDNGKTSLSRDIFTENLHWLTQLFIYDCYLETGLPSRLLENLKSLIYLRIKDGEIEGPVAHDALAGLANLLEITIRTPIKNGELPYAFFNGLKNLTAILLSNSPLDSIPPKSLDGLISLERIYLGNNNLQTLPLGLFDGLRSLEHVGLNSNPWNCSCELSWLLDWSNITVGAFCKEPLAVVDVKLEEAMVLLDCTSSSSTITSTSRFWNSQITTTEKAFVSTFPVLSTLNQAKTTIISIPRSTDFSNMTSLKKEVIFSKYKPTKYFAMSVTSTKISWIWTTTTHRTTESTSPLIASSTLQMPTISMKTSTTIKNEATLFVSNLSSLSSTRSTYGKTLYSSTSNSSVSLNNSNTNDNSANDNSNIIFGVGGALTALPVTATVVYRRACRKKGIDRVNDAETQGTDPQNKDETLSQTLSLETD